MICLSIGQISFSFISCSVFNRTTFVDCRVPQVLAEEAILRYSDCLKERLQKEETLELGDPDEVEICAGSTLAIHSIVNQVNENIPLERDIGDEHQRLGSILIDIYL